MPAKLQCRTGQLAGTDYEIAREATIGTSQDNDIVLYPQIISGKHARIYYEESEQCYFLEDLGSRNGTELDGVRVEQKEKLGTLHVLTFAGMFDFIFREQTDASKQAKETSQVEDPQVSSPPVEQKTVLGEDFSIPTALADVGDENPPSKDDVVMGKTRLDEGPSALPEIPEPQSVSKEPEDSQHRTTVDAGASELPEIHETEELKGEPDIAGADKTVLDQPSTPLPEIPSLPEKCEIVVEKIGESFKLKEGDNLVGRTVECDLYIDDVSISRRHAMIVCDERGVTVQDLGSKNHTFVDAPRGCQPEDTRLNLNLRHASADLPKQLRYRPPLGDDGEASLSHTPSRFYALVIHRNGLGHPRRAEE